MHCVSEMFDAIYAGEHRAEWKVRINGVDYDRIRELGIKRSVFTDTPTVGCAIAGEMKLVVNVPSMSIPKMAEIRPFVRITNGTLTSEWLPKGVFYIDTRSQSKVEGENVLTIEAYDAMLKGEQDCPLNNYPQSDIDAVTEIAGVLGVELDDDLVDQMTMGYNIPAPAEYSCREVLGYIAAMYAGSFIIDDFGHLRLVTLNGYPDETNYLVSDNDYVILIGGDRIIV